MSLRNWFSRATAAVPPGPKYELLSDETREIGDRTLYQIRAVRDFGKVKTGERGGFVMSEQNLSHDGNCWVHPEGEVFDNARVYGNAQVHDARVFEDALVGGNVTILPGAQVRGIAKVEKCEKIEGQLVTPPLTRRQRRWMKREGLDRPGRP